MKVFKSGGHSPVWKWIEIIELFFFFFMKEEKKMFWKQPKIHLRVFTFNKEKLCGTRIPVIFLDQNGKKLAIFLESLDFHRFTFTLGSVHFFVLKENLIKLIKTQESDLKLCFCVFRKYQIVFLVLKNKKS